MINLRGHRRVQGGDTDGREGQPLLRPLDTRGHSEQLAEWSSSHGMSLSSDGRPTLGHRRAHHATSRFRARFFPGPLTSRNDRPSRHPVADGHKTSLSPGPRQKQRVLQASATFAAAIAAGVPGVWQRFATKWAIVFTDSSHHWGVRVRLQHRNPNPMARGGDVLRFPVSVKTPLFLAPPEVLRSPVRRSQRRTAFGVAARLRTLAVSPRG